MGPVSPGKLPRPAPGDGPADQYFSVRPTSTSRPSEVTLTLPDLTLRLRTDAGVFSSTRVDPGTRLLLGALPPASEWPDGDVIDVGCGYGPIAVTLAHRAPERTVWAVDVNERARDLCRINATAARVADRVRIADPDGVPTDIRFGLVVSNPPVRIGKAALHDLCRRWLERLAPGGQAWWVVGKHLGSDSLQSWMTDEGWPTVRVMSRQSYRILLTTFGPDRPTAAVDPADDPPR